MKNSILKHAVAIGASVTTTLLLFSAVAALADDDKAALIAAKSVRGTQIVHSQAALTR